MRIGRGWRLSLLLVGVFCVLSAHEAAAVERGGYLIGFSLGAGTFAADGGASEGSHRSLALDLHTGTAITHNLAVVFDGWALGALEEQENEDDAAPVVGIDTLAMQFWPARRLWIKGGVGLGEYLPPAGDTRYGFGAMAAVGFELAQGDSFAMDVAARGGLASVDGKTHELFSVNLGFNWY
jgi:hypothetical protein